MAAHLQDEKSQIRGESAGQVQAGQSSNLVTLVSMDGDGFVVEASAIMVSQLIKVMVDGKGVHYWTRVLLCTICSCTALCCTRAPGM